VRPDRVLTVLRRLPKTYPERAAPIFNVHDTKGLKPDQVKQLNDALKGQIRLYPGKPMIFDVCRSANVVPLTCATRLTPVLAQICAFVQDWICNNNNLPKQDRTPNISLAAQLQSRTAEAERVRLPANRKRLYAKFTHHRIAPSRNSKPMNLRSVRRTERMPSFRTRFPLARHKCNSLSRRIGGDAVDTPSLLTPLASTPMRWSPFLSR